MMDLRLVANPERAAPCTALALALPRLPLASLGPGVLRRRFGGITDLPLPAG